MPPRRLAAMLRSVPIFAALPVPRLERLAERLHWNKYEKGQTIVEHSDGTNEVYLMLSGRGSVKIYASNGKVAGFRSLNPGDIFGEFAAIDEMPRSASVEANTESTVAVIGAEAFRDMLAKEPEVALALMEHFVRLIRELTRRIEWLTTKGVNQRIEAAIYVLALEAEPLSPGQPNTRWIRKLPLRAEWADELGTTREAISRHLTELERIGLIRRKRPGIVVNDLAGLVVRVEGPGD